MSGAVPGPVSSPETVVVTGSEGFLGRRVRAVLERRGVATRGLDLRARGDERVDVRLALDPRRLEGAAAVVHLAALGGVAPSLRRPAAYTRTNVSGTANVVGASLAAGVPRLVLASSSSIYGHCAEPAREDRRPAPLSPYARSKVTAEAVVREFVSDGRGGTSAVVVRPFTVYGPGQRHDMLIGRLLAGERLTLWPFERDFTFVDDVVDAVAEACVARMPSAFEVFNLGSGAPVAAHALLDAIRSATGGPPMAGWGDPRPGEPDRTWADPGRAVSLLGFRPDRPLADGLALQYRAARGQWAA